MSLTLWLCVDTGAGESICTEGTDVTHNVAPMWSKAGVYEALYKSEGKRAGDLLDVLQRGIAAMRADPDGFKQLNPPNGWGNYDLALQFLEEWEALCRKHPDARIHAWA